MPVFVLPDVLRPGLAIVFCGTAAGTESARRGAYYAHPQNRFWRTLHEAGLTPRRLAPAEFALLPEFGLGLTDIAKTESGMDRELPRGALGREACAALARRIEACAPRVLAFTSLAAGRGFLGRPGAGFGPQAATLGDTAIWLLPSPSPTAAWNFDIGPWRALAAAALLTAQVGRGNATGRSGGDEALAGGDRGGAGRRRGVGGGSGPGATGLLGPAFD